MIQVSYKDIHKGHLMLVNANHPLITETSSSDLVHVPSTSASIQLEKQTAKMLASVTAKLNCGQDIIPLSGYRSLDEQQTLYANALVEHGEAFTKKYVALPNCSEHQTGYAIDLAANQETIDPLTPTFPYYGIYQEFRQLSRKYGFIERYGANKTKVTGIGHEPWHFRYVGSPHAQQMYENDFALEEYISYLKQYPYSGQHLILKQGRYQYEVFYVNLKPDEMKWLEIPVAIPYQISGNNVDGVIVTLWRNV